MNKVVVTNLDSHLNNDKRMEPGEETVPWQIGIEGQNTHLVENLAKAERGC